MKKYTQILAVMVLSLFCAQINAASRDVKLLFYLTSQGRTLLDHPGTYIGQNELIDLFVLGSQVATVVTFDYLKPLVYWEGNDEAKHAACQKVVDEINGAKDVLRNGGLLTNKLGEDLLKNRLLSKDEIVELFVNGLWKSHTKKEDIDNKILEHFEVAGAHPTEKKATIELLVEAILEAQKAAIPVLNGLISKNNEKEVVNKDIIAVFVTGAYSHLRTKAEVQAKILQIFEVPGNDEAQKHAAIEPLVEDILAEQAAHPEEKITKDTVLNHQFALSAFGQKSFKTDETHLLGDTILKMYLLGGAKQDMLVNSQMDAFFDAKENVALGHLKDAIMEARKDQLVPVDHAGTIKLLEEALAHANDLLREVIK